MNAAPNFPCLRCAPTASPELLTILRAAGLRTLTLALEAPSHRLRTAANKHLSVEALLRAVTLAGEHGVNHLKFYLIIGWPGETPEDYDELRPLLEQIATAASIGVGKRGVAHATLSVNPLVPKPFTPMQWAPMASEAAIEAGYARIKQAAKGLKGFRVETETASMARLQGLLARGDERLFPLIAAAVTAGSFRRALKTWDGDPAFYLDRQRPKDERLPWDIIDNGVSRDYLWQEWERYQAGIGTAKCPPAGCASCKRCGKFTRPAKGRRTPGKGVRHDLAAVPRLYRRRCLSPAHSRPHRAYGGGLRAGRRPQEKLAAGHRRGPGRRRGVDLLRGRPWRRPGRLGLDP